MWKIPVRAAVTASVQTGSCPSDAGGGSAEPWLASTGLSPRATPTLGPQKLLPALLGQCQLGTGLQLTLSGLFSEADFGAAMMSCALRSKVAPLTE